MNELKIFENQEFGRIRTVVVNDEPMFVGSDIAKALGYSNPQKAVRDHVDEDDRTICSVTDSLGREQESIVINESGVYTLVMSSKLPQAKQFKRWVTSEVFSTLAISKISNQERTFVAVSISLNNFP